MIRPILEAREEMHENFRSVFGSNENFKICFRDYLTFKRYSQRFTLTRQFDANFPSLCFLWKSSFFGICKTRRSGYHISIFRWKFILIFFYKGTVLFFFNYLFKGTKQYIKMTQNQHVLIYCKLTSLLYDFSWDYISTLIELFI